MKSIIKSTFLFAAVAGLFAACDKVDALPFYENGTATTLSASSTTIAPAPADSNNTALTLNWTAPNYATDSSTVKFTIELDSAGKGFSKPYTKVVRGVSNTSFTAKELNTFLVNRGYAFGQAVTLDARVTSAYANNNQSLASNTVQLQVTPYKIPPKIALPTSNKLYIVGDATAGGWNNPVPAPAQELARLDETTFGGVFYFTGGKQYLILPVNGSWDAKYAVANNTVAGLSSGGEFGFNLNDNFPAPASDGWYKLTLDFQSGRFTVVPYTSTPAEKLFIVGDATAGGWNNPVPEPAQQLTRINASQFEITLPLVGGKQYLLLPQNGSWDHKYAVADNSMTGAAEAGMFGYDLSQNFPGPAESGTYKIAVNFYNNTYTVTKQ